MPPPPSPALTGGTRLGPYEVLAAIGAGGMGEIYRARDTRLDRVGALSPDGRFLAYASDETGHYEVYVRPYPSVDQGRWQISVEGGVDPR